MYFGENISKEASYSSPQRHETEVEGFFVFFFFLFGSGLMREHTHHQEDSQRKGWSWGHTLTQMHKTGKKKNKEKEYKKHCPEVNSTLKQHPSLIWEHSCSSGTTRVMQH